MIKVANNLQKLMQKRAYDPSRINGQPKFVNYDLSGNVAKPKNTMWKPGDPKNGLALAPVGEFPQSFMEDISLDPPKLGKEPDPEVAEHEDWNKWVNSDAKINSYATPQEYSMWLNRQVGMHNTKNPNQNLVFGDPYGPVFNTDEEYDVSHGFSHNILTPIGEGYDKSFDDLNVDLGLLTDSPIKRKQREKEIQQEDEAEAERDQNRNKQLFEAKMKHPQAIFMDDTDNRLQLEFEKFEKQQNDLRKFIQRGGYSPSRPIIPAPDVNPIWSENPYTNA